MSVELLPRVQGCCRDTVLTVPVTLCVLSLRRGADGKALATRGVTVTPAVVTRSAVVIEPAVVTKSEVTSAAESKATATADSASDDESAGERMSG